MDTNGPSGSAGGISKDKVEVPMRGFKVFIIGRLSQSKPILTKKIEDLGGKVVSKVTENTTICISDKSKSIHSVD